MVEWMAATMAGKLVELWESKWVVRMVDWLGCRLAARMAGQRVALMAAQLGPRMADKTVDDLADWMAAHLERKLVAMRVDSSVVWKVVRMVAWRAAK